MKSTPRRTDTPRAPRLSMMHDWDQRSSPVVDGQDLEQRMHHRRIGLVEDGVIDVAGLEKVIGQC
jgi:hypothetical protein